MYRKCSLESHTSILYLMKYRKLPSGSQGEFKVFDQTTLGPDFVAHEIREHLQTDFCTLNVIVTLGSDPPPLL